MKTALHAFGLRPLPAAWQGPRFIWGYGIAVAMTCWGTDFLRLVAGGVLLGMVGAAACRVLGLRAPRHFCLPYHIVCGQLFLVLYIYLRTAVCDVLPFGLVGVTSVELLTLGLAGAIVLAARGQTRAYALRPGIVCGWVLWFAWLCVVAQKKLGLLYTPSSDPDLHAFFARHFVRAGKILYGEIPGTDVLFSYPAGFAVLNQVWVLLTGLTPVQVVNLQCYMQYLLFLGIAYAMLTRMRLSRTAQCGLAATLFILLPLLLNPLWLHGREHLEGTARLAHTALLFFPLALLFENRGRIRKRWARVLGVTVLAICYGAAINPSHAFVTVILVVVAALAFGTPLLWPCRHVSLRSWVAGLACLSVIPLLFLWFDPYYRPYLINPVLFGDHTFHDKRWGSVRKVVAERPLLRADSAAKFLPAVASKIVHSNWLSIPGKKAVLQRVVRQTTWIALGAVLICWALRWRGRLPCRMRLYVRLAAVAVAFGLMMKVLNGTLGVLISEEHLNGMLLLGYTSAAEFQGLALLYHVVLCLPWSAGGTLLQTSQSRHPIWGAMVIWIALCMPALYYASEVRRDCRHFYRALSRTSMGEITMDDIKLLKWAEQHVPTAERILLPGVVVQTPLEDWIFPFRTSRAAGLYSNLQTAFFFGIDGQEYTAGAYLERVQEHFDRAWLVQRQIRWTFGTPEFPSEHLERHFTLAQQIGKASLWRLKPAP